MPYSPMLIKPFKEELTETGVKELLTADDVDKALDQDGIVLIVVNSVCGCAAAVARPAVRKVMEDETGRKPDKIYSVFAGQDLEATQRFRNHIADIPPSSPCFALFKDRELIYFIPKHRIEMRDANAVASDLLAVFEEYA
ncbi:BrxA/BrxB family bacilliredoxin [Chitinophaga sp. Cy-1792]|uniref:BrxA/BrxB family bacilliredoxin n=1 Tax=Chitinophaga sp. Cy-1792 TaxID=2608339 RepID=UPI0014213B00|nr:BrxA/BrxB family bacilliredoxin [Chitinophaga sp. Cy-1792]NIG54074.1 BrxA/BrxB family bacilliredoxin [Chitinophaga sp. Cy-1792]